MDSPELDIKPTIPTDDIPDKSLLAVGVGKLKQSRYEDVWPEDVHAAFMEAVALYPPMGKRRLKYYRISTHENVHFSDANRAKSFGRCQLIQSYILEKTGKNRSRKQVSSHLQRLKKIHKNNPAMCYLFSEPSEPPSDCCPIPQTMPTPASSQDIFANISFSTRHFKNDCDVIVDVQNANTYNDNSPAFPCAPEVSSFNDSSCNVPDFSTNLHNQPSVLFSQELPSPEQSSADALRPFESDYLAELQDSLLFKDVMNGGFRASTAFNTSAFLISMRRLASRLPMQDQVESYPTTHLSRAVHTSAFQPPYQWVSYDDLMDDVPCNSPLAPARQWFHAPLQPQSFPTERQRFDQSLTSDWTWPQNSDIRLGPREGTFGESFVGPRYPLTIYQPNSTYSNIETSSPGFYSPPSESEVSKFSHGTSYSYVATTPPVVSECVSAPSAIDFSGQSVQIPPKKLASPTLVRPTPVYPVSYIHFDDDGAIHTPALLP